MLFIYLFIFNTIVPEWLHNFISLGERKKDIKQQGLYYLHRQPHSVERFVVANLYAMSAGLRHFSYEMLHHLCN